VIRTAHCSVGRVKKVFSSKKKGSVIAESPAAGTRHTGGTAVSLTVSKGLKPKRSH
jgi:beta-lactam-binding protein with PASTA domain